MLPKSLSLTELPAGPKRLANAFERAGWTWNADEAARVWHGDEKSTHVYSIVVRGKSKTGRMIAARWESLDRGKMSVVKCYMAEPGKSALEYSVTEVFGFIV